MKLETSLRLKPDLLYVAPLLNLVFLLLIFFLLNSTMVVKSGIQVDLPHSSSALRNMDDADIVTLTAGPEPKIYFNRDETTWVELPQRIRQSPSKSRQVIIHADALVAHGQVVRAQDIILAEGRGANLATLFSQ
jgi:biopolymer transport protein ExbD